MITTRNTPPITAGTTIATGNCPLELDWKLLFDPDAANAAGLEESEVVDEDEFGS